MHRKVRQYLKKSLCGILSAAMILTSLSVPDMTVIAAPSSVAESVENADTDKTVEETISAANGEEVPDTDADDSGEDGAEKNDEDSAFQQENEETSDENNMSSAEETSTDEDQSTSETEDAASEEDSTTETDTEEESASETETETDTEENLAVNVEEKENATYGTLANGGFEETKNIGDSTNALWAPVPWKMNPAFDGGGNFKLNKIDSNHGNSSLYIWKSTETEISVSQVITNMEPGAYMVNLEAGGVYSKDQVTLKVESVEKATEADEEYLTVIEELQTQSLGSCDAWGKWNKIETTPFKVVVPAEKAEVNVKITISGTIASSGEEQIYFDNITFVTHKLADLNKLLTDAGAFDEADYTAESWAVFDEKKSAAQSLVESGANDTEKALEILEAYIALKAAMDNLKPSTTSTEVTFYYYAGDTEDEVGLYYWGDNISTKADLASWKVYTDKNAYLLTPVSGYAGWYSVPITFINGGETSGFEIFENSDTANAKVKYSSSENQAVYTDLATGKNEMCAYKNSINYTGTDESTKSDKATAILRNITLYAYDENTVPVIQLDNKSAASTLSVVNEETGAVTVITPSGKDSYDNNVYELQKVTENENWYSISFSVPGAIQFDSQKIAGWFAKDSSGAYNHVKDMANGPTSNDWEYDFTQVFSGNTYYKDGKFYKTKEDAEAVTFKMLKDLLASEDLKKITDKGEAGYTPETWAPFSTALTEAQKAAADNSSQADEYTDEAITKAYRTLQSAMDALVPLSADVTFYYYAGAVEDELGLYYWDNSAAKTNLTSTADKADWNVWEDGDTYRLTAVEGYAGWYSIPLSFMNGGDSAGFQIFTKTAATAADSAEKVPAYKCDADDNADAYAELASGTNDMGAVKNGKAYLHDSADMDNNLVTAIMRQVTLYVYDAKNTPHLQMGGTVKPALSVVDEETGALVPLEGITIQEQNGYAFQQDEEHTNWYSITFSAPGKFGFDSAEKICNLYKKDSAGTFEWVKDMKNGPTSESWEVDFTAVFAGLAYYKDGKFYATMEEADPEGSMTPLDSLRKLVGEAKELKEQDYKRGWKAFAEALQAAEALLALADDETQENPAEADIQKAYNDLKNAIDALVPASVQDAEINVQKVALADDFITGADLSSYIALKDSGVVFKDENGTPLSDAEFFNYLHDGGMNWVRIRIWNDPYNSSGNGYGGGNNDLEKAIRLGQLATNAKMRVLIDFHYSDFWADPKKQKAPKAWAGYNIAQKEDAVYSFTLDSLNALRDAGVDIGMVQVGNETNNGICGETSWDNMAALFSAGSRAVRQFDKNCLVAVHFTDPQKGYGSIASRLDASKVDYDVFASSFYPFGHGDTANLKAVLTDVVEKYGKKVMAAETSWPTTLIDGDGYGTATPPTIPPAYEDQNYGVSVQGQADEMRDLVNAVNQINDTYAGSSIGVFYWEPAWISPYYIKDEDGNDIDSLYKQNFDLWEKYGSGWASSYAAEYDPDDAGVWFGGSAMDNSSWFDFDGTALPTAKIYSLIRTGATAEKKIASVDSNPVLKVPLGETFIWPSVTAKYNDGTETQISVTWDEDEKELVNIYKAGEYIVHGIASAEGRDYKITLKIQVLRAAANNILVNPDFENGLESPWNIVVREGHGEAESDPAVRVSDEDPHGGMKGLHFWSKVGLDATISQTVRPEAGIYTFGSYIQGDGADREDVQYAFARVLDKDGKQKSTLKASFTLNGWKNWSNPEITGITVEDGDTLEVGLIMKSTQDGAWGTMDDFYLYGTHTVSTADNISHGTVAANVVKANSGEKVSITVTPDSGYYPVSVTLSGASVKADTLTSSNGTVDYIPAAEGSTVNQAVLKYAVKAAEEKTEIFMMPNGNVTISAEFASVFENGKIRLDAKDESGRYLVKVNAGESDEPDGENPIPAQFHTGKDVKPEIVLSYNGYELTAADYTAAFENNKTITTDTSKAKLTLTAKGDKFEGTREIFFEIKEDTRKDFNAKALKVVYEAPDNGERTATPAKAVYYLGKEKEIEPKIRLYAADDTTWEKPVPEDLYQVYYQKNNKVGKAEIVVLPTDKALRDPSGYKEGSISAAFTIAKCPVNQENMKVKISTKPNYFTGKKVEPSITVEYTYTGQNGEQKTVTLAKGTDYTVSCTNNVNASVYKVVDAQGNAAYQNINDKKVPTIKITGKGNFTGARTTVDLKDGSKPGSEKLTFQIRPKNLENTVVTVADLAEKTSAQAPKITVKDGAKTVAASQYRITEIVRTHDGAKKPLENPELIYSLANNSGSAKVQLAGTYEIRIEGKEKSNYEGAKGVSNAGSKDKLICRVVDKDHLIDNAKVSISGKLYYTGNGIVLSTAGSSANLTVKAGNVVLTGYQSYSDALSENGEEKDGYYVTYTNNVNAGKAVATITGTGAYIGTKAAVFTINKRTIAKEVQEKDRDKKGLIQMPKLSAKGAKEKLDGTWTAQEQGALINSDNNETGSLLVPYTGYTINPDFRFASKNYDLAGTELPDKELASSDYTVSYKVGKWADGKAPVTVTVKGKGNYSGSVKFDNLFSLTERELDKLSIDVEPVTYNGKASKPAVRFYDENGKAVDLKLNTAYTVSYKNNKDSRAVNKDPNKQPTVTVKVKGNGWKTSSDPATTSCTKTFAIDQAEITKADISDVVFQRFLGKALKPKVVIKVNGKKLKEGKDFVVTYKNNVKRGGSATIQITGKGNYFTREPIQKIFVIK